ncbi:MAG: hypothetical protein A2Z83_07995 [Omnitrophica bacterium GWA2_52_8]|nr:MAG: hypothetical protein A2Z83_07995 [Omnitrophica bacterium GWA2_52_8]
MRAIYQLSLPKAIQSFKAGKLLLRNRSEHKSNVGLYAPHCAFEHVFDSIENAPQELPTEKFSGL